VAEVQPAIGAFVQNASDPTADTNYIGVNTNVAYKTNVLGEDFAAGFTCPSTEEAATGGIASWVQAGDAIAEGGRGNIVAGVMSANGTGTHVCHVAGGVVAGDFFWATDFA
jgi:hypothetical protein